MKRKQEKQNNTKHSLKKLIALWVVFVLLVVPFANHVSGRDDVKAEGETPTTSEEYYTDNLSEVGVDYFKYDTTASAYYMQYLGDACPQVTAKNVYYAADKVYMQVNPEKIEDKQYNYTYVNGQGSASTSKASVERLEVVYVKAGNTETDSIYKQTISDDVKITDLMLTGDLASKYPDGIAVYIQPVIKESIIVGDEGNFGIEKDALQARMGYTLVGLYKFSKASNPTITWTGTNKTDTNVAVTDSTTKYKSASINVTGGNTTDTAGTWKYKYLKADENGNIPADDSVKSQEGWGDSCPILDKDTGISDGTYYGYAGYFVNNADGTQTLLKSVSTAIPVALDVTAPVVTISAEYKDGDSYKPITIDDIDTTYSSNPSEGIFYVLKSETIRFSIESDEDANISSSWGDLSVTENVPQYTNKFDVNTIQNNDSYSVTVADNVGNETTASFMLDGRTILFTKEYSKFELQGATVKGVNIEKVLGDIDIDEYWVTRYGEPSVEFTFLSDENIKAVTGEPTNKYEYQITGLTDVVEDVSFSRPYYTTKVSKSLEEGTYTIELKMYNGNF